MATSRTSEIRVLRRPVESALGAVIGVYDRSGEAAAGAFGGGQGVDDEIGAHVIGDRPAGQAP
ncbi:hypothetical protein ACPC4G_33785 [Streptomyces cellulosae]